jgi:purine-binding chemotaxis protein CheW
MPDRVLLFELAGQRFGFPALRVRECLPLPRLWREPHLTPHVAGFFSLGGRVTPVLDPRSLLNLQPSGGAVAVEPVYRHLVRTGDAVLLVDRVLDVLEAAPPAGPDAPPPDEVPPAMRHWRHRCFLGWLLLPGGPVALIDPDRLLEDAERAQLDLLAAEAERRRELWGP